MIIKHKVIIYEEVKYRYYKTINKQLRKYKYIPWK